MLSPLARAKTLLRPLPSPTLGIRARTRRESPSGQGEVGRSLRVSLWEEERCSRPSPAPSSWACKAINPVKQLCLNQSKHAHWRWAQSPNAGAAPGRCLQRDSRSASPGAAWGPGQSHLSLEGLEHSRAASLSPPLGQLLLGCRHSGALGTKAWPKFSEAAEGVENSGVLAETLFTSASSRNDPSRTRFLCRIYSIAASAGTSEQAQVEEDGGPQHLRKILQLILILEEII